MQQKLVQKFMWSEEWNETSYLIGRMKQKFLLSSVQSWDNIQLYFSTVDSGE